MGCWLVHGAKLKHSRMGFWAQFLGYRCGGEGLGFTRGGGPGVLTLSESSSILVVSCTSGALGTITGIGGRLLPRVPMEAVFTA